MFWTPLACKLSEWIILLCASFLLIFNLISHCVLFYSAGEKVIRHGSNYMQGDSITVELAAKAADMYNLESREKSAKLKKNIFLENSAKRDPVYEDGSLVLVSFDGPVPEAGRRPSVVWKGPFTVVSKSLSGMYQLRGGDGVVHEHPVDRLKPFKISDLK